MKDAENSGHQFRTRSQGLTIPFMKFQIGGILKVGNSVSEGISQMVIGAMHKCVIG